MRVLSVKSAEPTTMVSLPASRWVSVANGSSPPPPHAAARNIAAPMTSASGVFVRFMK
jgi:hypothetical protein